MEILVTGGSGFIGRNIVRALKERGHAVTTLDIRGKDSLSDRHIVGDIRERDIVEKATRGKDYVFHLAATTSPPEFEDLMGSGFETNVIGTYNVLASSSVNGVKRVVLASSSSVYGSSTEISRESSIPYKYENFYPVSKLFNEITARTLLNYNLETVSLRYFNTYGIGENSKGPYSSIIWKFIEDIRNGRRPVIYGDGRQRRDFIYVEDAANASVLAMLNGIPGESYNVGTGVSVEFNEIFRIIKEEMGYDGEAEYIKNPLKSYQMFTQADMTKTKMELKFEPKYDIRKGVKKILEEIY